jgi:hypothetical protein
MNLVIAMCRPRSARMIGLLAAAAVLAGCSLERFGSDSERPATAPTGPLAGPTPGSPEAPRAAQTTPPPLNMDGRWLLVAAGGGRCGMNFGASPGAGEGTIAPEGGCPGNFYTSRRWTFEQGALVIRDHNGQPLGQLALASPGRFDGKAVNGQPVTLTR